MSDQPWQPMSNCLGIDPAMFFPGRGEDTTPARAVCEGCQVRVECLEFALDQGEKYGIWGGLSERERRRIRRTRRLAGEALRPDRSNLSG